MRLLPERDSLREHYSVRWTGKIIPEKSGDYKVAVTADDGARLWLNGQQVIDDWHEHPRTTDAAMFHFEAGVAVDLRLEYYQGAGQASIDFGWAPKGLASPEIEEAVDLAKHSDVAIIVAGIIEGEGQDRAHLDLPGNQEELIRRVAATGKPTVVVLLAGSSVTMEHWYDQIPAILDVHGIPAKKVPPRLRQQLRRDGLASGSEPGTADRCTVEAACMTVRTNAVGMAKPMPIEPPDCGSRGVDADELPSRSTRAPPELPGLIAASVWMKEETSLPMPVRARAETIPLVTV